MNNKNNNDGLPDLYMMSDKIVEEISECSEGLDAAAKERIIKLCEKKLGISENTEGSDKAEKTAQVKKYASPKWYRAAIASAACLFLVTCVVLVKNNMKPADPDTPVQVVTSQTEETTQTSVSQTSENTGTDKPITNENQDQNDEIKDVYDLNVEKISAKDIYECSQPYTMPETINGYDDYYINSIRDKESVYVTLILYENNQYQVGIYNFVNNTYTAIMDIPLGDQVVCYTDDYVITSISDGVDYGDGKILSLLYYDVKKNTSEIIFNRTSATIYDDTSEVRHSTLSILNGSCVYNNCFYFGVNTRLKSIDDIDSDIYKYNFLNNELTLVRKHAGLPIVINNSVGALIINPEKGMSDTIQIIEGDDNFSCNVEDGVCSLYSTSNGIYGVYSTDFTTFTLKELISQNIILSKRAIKVLYASDNLLGLSDIEGREQIPFAYDINRNKIVEFDFFQKYYRDVYAKDDYGVIFYHDFSGNEEKQLIFFQPKSQ